MLKLKLQYFGHLMQRADSLEKTLMLGKIEGRMASPTQWTWVWVHSGSWWWTGRPGMLQFMGSQTVGHNWATELNWDTSGSISSLWSFSFTWLVSPNAYWSLVDHWYTEESYWLERQLDWVLLMHRSVHQQPSPWIGRLSGMTLQTTFSFSWTCLD